MPTKEEISKAGKTLGLMRKHPGKPVLKRRCKKCGAWTIGWGRRYACKNPKHICLTVGGFK